MYLYKTEEFKRKSPVHTGAFNRLRAITSRSPIIIFAARRVPRIIDAPSHRYRMYTAAALRIQ